MYCHNEKDKFHLVESSIIQMIKTNFELKIMNAIALKVPSNSYEIERFLPKYQREVSTSLTSLRLCI